MSLQDTVEIDPRGDLILDVCSETTPRSLRVSSRALCLASPVFRTMLQSPLFHEGRALRSATRENPFQMRLHDDGYEPVLIMVNILHCKAPDIPSIISLDLLYRLAIVCDKYDVAENFRPWVKIWKAHLADIPRGVACQKWLVVAWVFRLRKSFEFVTKEMICQDSYSVFESDGSIETGVIPDRVFESVNALKQATAASLLSLAAKEAQASLHSLSNANILNPHRPGYVQNPCSSIARGGHMRCLFVAGLWPSTFDTCSSIQSILNAFISMETYCIYRSPGLSTPLNSCKQLDRAAKEIFYALEGLHLADFCSQDTNCSREN